MKFLCDNCKAKYQIPDEKVSGRTLRMTCRKCGNDILIRGAGVAPSVVPPAAAPASSPAPVAVPGPAPVPSVAKASVPARAPASVPAKAPAPAAAVPKKAAAAVPAKAAGADASGARVPAKAPAPSADSVAAATGRPSALGADFRKKVGSEGQDAGSLRASAPAAPPAAAEEWHVAINDVPVGPIRRDEIARKIGTGAVTGDSLAWREGFDDWRPLRDIPQLASLLEQRRRPSVPPATRSTPSSTAPRPSGPRTRSGGSGAFNLPTSDRSSSNLVPLGGRAVAPVAPPANVMPDSDAPEDDFALEFQSPSSAPPAAAPVPRAARTAPVAVAAAAPAPLAATPAPRVSEAPRERESSQKTPVWVWGMLAGGIFFGIVLGMKGSEWFGSQDPVVAAAPTATPEVADPVTPQPLEIPEAPATVDAGIVAEPETPTDTVRHGTPGTRPVTTTGTMATATAANDSAFAAFESPTGMTVTPTDLTTGMSAAAAPPLEAAAVQRVVTNNRRQLQTCYERAARGQANPPRARMDVSVTVGRSGTVTAVSASGSDFGGLGACIEQSVRRWRFPASSDGGNTRFPVVFSAGG
ncbi:MAG: zinc-ribbon domain-containing protein [Sandaracinaceae bacterium]|jgi:predicted Zn finger-like uncharacterized protein|nr:zinc-ribbon domain-containing protein [Sandaracinaceae bacterium]MBP7681619.1 zinc-ribbon domain-containing protein [Deltaproteobacteria bacterium]MBK6807670.1 zinc-ribbon domain-containing protein [Sandaracinaceae bacterium]MBK7155206.1 zinc-ribbon domain-containing protein [Sandaracinaceae bacterium]MBK7774400.1 zinc-ribbon domain-containing protein [Sandaracinaceae bacterium]